jgi:hypothetical protein
MLCRVEHLDADAAGLQQAPHLVGRINALALLLDENGRTDIVLARAPPYRLENSSDQSSSLNDNLERLLRSLRLILSCVERLPEPSRLHQDRFAESAMLEYASNRHRGGVIPRNNQGGDHVRGRDCPVEGRAHQSQGCEAPNGWPVT